MNFEKAQGGFLWVELCPLKRYTEVLWLKYIHVQQKGLHSKYLQNGFCSNCQYTWPLSTIPDNVSCGLIFYVNHFL